MATAKKPELDFIDGAGIEAKDFDAPVEPAKTPKSAEQLLKDSMKADAEIQTKVNQCRNKLRAENKQKIRISPAYKPYLGSKCQIIINGVPIVVPCDGSMVEIPDSYAAELYRRMAGIDAMIDQQVRMSNYNGNREQTIGEIKF